MLILSLTAARRIRANENQVLLGEIMKMFHSVKYLGMALGLMVAASAAMASGGFSAGGNIGGQLTGYAGSVQGGSSSVTSGGSQSEAAVTNNGFASVGSVTAGGGKAFAGGSINSAGVTTKTDITSYTNTASFGVQSGNAGGNSNAANGTDVNAASVGTFQKAAVGASLSGFANIGFGH